MCPSRRMFPTGSWKRSLPNPGAQFSPPCPRSLVDESVAHSLSGCPMFPRSSSLSIPRSVSFSPHRHAIELSSKLSSQNTLTLHKPVQPLNEQISPATPSTRLRIINYSGRLSTTCPREPLNTNSDLYDFPPTFASAPLTSTPPM